MKATTYIQLLFQNEDWHIGAVRRSPQEIRREVKGKVMKFYICLPHSCNWYFGLSWMSADCRFCQNTSMMLVISVNIQYPLCTTGGIRVNTCWKESAFDAVAKRRRRRKLRRRVPLRERIAVLFCSLVNALCRICIIRAWCWVCCPYSLSTLQQMLLKSVFLSGCPFWFWSLTAHLLALVAAWTLPPKHSGPLIWSS